MDIKQAILDQLTTAATDKIAAKNKLDTSQTNTAVDTALNAILGGLQSNVGKKAGAEKLDSALQKDHSGSVLDDIIGALGDGTTQKDGAKILEHIFGGKTGKVTDTVAKKAGVDAGAAGGILEALAPIVLGQLGKTKKSQGLDAGGVADTILRQKLPKGGVMDGIAQLLDRDKDGQILDDLLDIGQGLLGSKKK
ncbi:MAG: DUF937 domain-containing protein [Candidatus Saccharimonadales bacterium]